MLKVRMPADRRRNRKRTAKFNAQSYDNRRLKKCLITIASEKTDYEDLLALTKLFIGAINSKKRNKKFRDGKFLYYGVMEAGDDYESVPRYHIHFQCYYTHLGVIEHAFKKVREHKDCNQSRCDISHLKKSGVKFTYVIKHFYPSNYDATREAKIREWSKGKNRVFNSRKEMPDYLITRLLSELSKLPDWDKDRDNYPIIMELISKGVIEVKKLDDLAVIPNGFTEIKKWCYLIDWSCIK